MKEGSLGFRPVGLTPSIGVFDMTESLAFCRNVIGFEVVPASPEVATAEGRFSHFMWLRFGGADLMLNTLYDSDERPERRGVAVATAQGLTFYIGCIEIDAAYAELAARGLTADPRALAPYGLKLFSSKDPNGCTVAFQEVR